MNKLPERFIDKFNITGDCWIWAASKRGNGYGYYWTGEKGAYAHRYSWTHFNGNIPENMNVLHKCDNRLCVNPDHLFLGTQQENITDMFAKGRNSRGEDRSNSRLTDSQVEEIRRIYIRGVPGYKSDFSQPWIAKKYGVSAALINRIVNHKERIPKTIN